MASKKDIEAVNNAEMAVKVHNQRKKNEASAKNSELKTIVGMTKTFTVDEDGTPYSVTLRHPGVPRAVEIMDIAQNQFGNVVYSELMRQAIQDVIVSPKINSLDFFNTHNGFGEIAVEIRSFLEQRV